MPNSQAMPSVLVLSENESSSALERRALRDAGFTNVRMMTSGIAAARLLAGLDSKGECYEPDLVVCSQKLEDMDGEQFCAIIRQHPGLLALPVLLVMPNDSEAEQLKTLGCGASALLGRPYSVEVLRKLLLDLASARPRRDKLRQAAQAADTSAFDTALATYGILLRSTRQPEDFFQVGMRCLEAKRWDVAISAFQHALSNAQIKAEAEIGMAAAFKGKGDLPRFKGWLGRAAGTLVRAKRWHQARTAFARLLQHDPEARNPFLTEAHRLIHQKEYEEAAEALAQSLNMIPKGRTGERFARVCMAAEDPEAMLKALEASLGKGSANDFLNAEIRQSLEGMARQRDDRKREMEAERKWQLARRMSGNKAAQKDADDLEKKEAIAEVQTKAAENTPFEPCLAEDDLDPAEDQAEEADISAPAEVLAPLTQREATSDLFTKKPRLNELLSVVKLTWKLARITGKNDK